MREAEVFLVFTRPLESADISYMVTGGVASIIYGEPRMTHDIDIVIDLAQDTVDTLLRVFPADEFYRPPKEVVLREVRRRQRGHFNLIDNETGFKADCYTAGSDPLHRWALRDRQRVELNEGESLWVAPPEYVIVRKLQFYRESEYEKHLDDISGMLEASPDLIDLEQIERLVERWGLGKEWERVGERSPNEE